MSYVFYDVETTGLRKRYDQITAFAAVQTDNDLNVTDSFEVSAQVCPHIIPAPGAVHVTGVGIDRLFDPSLPSQFDAVVAIHDKMTAWCPALFAGYNSVSFDEELLRHAFYQNLKPAFLTSKQGNARADILGLCRVTAAQRPDVLVPAQGPDGRKVFRLAELAAANGLSVGRAHSAMIDVMTTLTLCRHVKTGAPELWSTFARFATKAAVNSFTDAEDGFLYFSARPGPDDPLVLTRLGNYANNPTRIYCLDLLQDLDWLAGLDDSNLAHVLAERGGPLVTLRLNAAPIMTELFQGTTEQLGGLSEVEVVARAVRVRSEPALGPRILAFARAAETAFAPAAHVEEQLYGHPFPGRRDNELMVEFHGSDWPRRAGLVREFDDKRLQQLARRIVYFHRPELLPVADATAMRRGITERHMSTGNVPWLTLNVARVEMAKLSDDLAVKGETESRALAGYRAHLDKLDAPKNS